MKNLTVETARQFLTEQGYFTENLWHLDDVMSRYECDEQTAYEILGGAVCNEFIMEHINEQIIEQAEYDYELKPKDQ